MNLNDLHAQRAAILQEIRDLAMANCTTMSVRFITDLNGLNTNIIELEKRVPTKLAYATIARSGYDSTTTVALVRAVSAAAAFLYESGEDDEISRSEFESHCKIYGVEHVASNVWEQFLIALTPS